MPMSEYTEQIQGWLREPLRNLQESCRSAPDADWTQRFAGFLHELGLSSAAEHPVTASLAEVVDRLPDSNSERAAYVASDAVNTLVDEQIEALAATDVPAQPEPGDPGEVSEQALAWFGLPALRDLAAADPDLLGRHGVARVTAVLTSVLVYRLHGQSPPEHDELSEALLARVEGHLGGNPEVAALFYRTFGPSELVLADQWVTYQLGLAGAEITTLVPIPVPVPAVETPAVGTPAVETPAATHAPTADPALVAQVLRDVPDAAEVLTPEEIDSLIAEVLAESRG
jgi:hypothetical protein